MNSNKYGIKYWYNKEKLEVGLDECARGCLLGRTYMACVVWNPDFLEEVSEDAEFKWIHKIRDSKKLSAKVRTQLYDLIKEYSLAYSIQWADEKEIDKKNILQAVQDGFHRCIESLPFIPDTLYVDGSYFNPYYCKNGDILTHKCIEQGDNKFLNIASASILAKVEHDKYIETLCNKYPELKERYDIHNNMGYGTQKHIQGIQTYGITDFHRKTFGICKEK